MRKMTMLGGLFVLTMKGFDAALVNSAKAAGFRFHWGVASGKCYASCKACKTSPELPPKTWWTDRVESASQLSALADDVAQAALGSHKAEVAASAASTSTADLPRPAGLEYLPYQKAGIEYALKRDGVLFGDEPGLGKTIQALGVMNADHTVKNVLVVCPASLRINWVREAQKWLTREFNYCVLESARAELPETASFVVISDSLVAKFLPRLMSRSWDALVVDEAHRNKNARGAQRARAVLGEDKYDKATKTTSRVRGLVDCARRKMFLTGTPMPNGRPVELQPLAAALDKATFGNFFGFAKRYANAVQGRYGWDFSGCNMSRMPELQEKLRATVMVRRLKADVLTDLPAKRRQVIVLPCNGAAKAVAREQAAYSQHEETLEVLHEAVDFAHASGDDAAYTAAVVALSTGMKVAFEEMSAARQEVALAKVPTVVEHVNALLEEEKDDGSQMIPKVVVFAHHHAVVDALTAEFGALAVRLDGRMSADEKQDSVDAFQTNPAVRVFVGSIGAAGVGLTLTAAAHMVFAELDWVPGNVSQAEDRCHRIGQTSHLLVQHLVLDGSIDAKLAQAVVAKQERCDAALDDVTEAVVPEPLPPVVTAGPRPAPRQPRPETYPVASRAKKDAVLLCLRILAGMCDGAVARDGAGFNKVDSGFGHQLAALAALNDGQATYGARMVNKYYRQLPEALLAVAKGE